MDYIRKTKIICTIGPASEDPCILRKMMEMGMNVCRLNFSHGNHAEHLVRIEAIKQLRTELDLPVAILMDLKGPEVRTQLFENDRVELITGQQVTIVQEDVLGNAERFSTTYKGLAGDLSVNSRILIDDGLIELAVEKIEGNDLSCRVIEGGEISNHKSINLPGISLHLPALTEKDEADLRFAVEQDFDFVAASFVRRAMDVIEIRRVLERFGGSNIKIIAKIENQEGVNNFSKILDVADGIMVARGDLGVEIPEHEVPTVQKRLIRMAYQKGKPCITATQMLDSMMRRPRPTRAESSDVANAVLDGTSAVMLSGETAAGKYPLESLQVMDRIASYTEKNFDYWDAFNRAKTAVSPSVANAVSHACCMTAYELGAQAIISVTHSGRTARLVSRFRPACPIFATTVTQKSRYQLALSWGVIPHIIEEFHNTDELFEVSERLAKESGLVNDGDVVVISCGTPVGISGTTNTLKVTTVGSVLCQGKSRSLESRQQVSGDVLNVFSLDPLKIDLLLESRDEVAGSRKEFILVAKETVPEMLPLMRQAKAVIVEDPNPDGHAVTVCDALEIPIIYDAANATRLLKTGQLVVLDLNSGLVS